VSIVQIALPSFQVDLERMMAVTGTTVVDSCNSRRGPVQLIAYYRVSTARQGDSGLGLEAQSAKVEAMAAEKGGEIIAEFVEIESGRKSDRPQLAAAMNQARKLGAVVAVAKLDRLARDAELVLRLSREAEKNGFGGLLFADLPEADCTTAAGRLLLSLMASVAEFEGRRISERTKEALAAAKARGRKLGGIRKNTITRNEAARTKASVEAESLRPILEPMVAAGYSLRQMSNALAAAGRTNKKGEPLAAVQIARILERLHLKA
jgi:DNA invertase Pin-like site-specific DNA recombinase